MADEGIYISKYDGTATDGLLDIVEQSRDNFPFDTELDEGSQHGVTNAAVAKAVKALKESTGSMKGYFMDLEALMKAYPEAAEGSKAYVGTNHPYKIYLYSGGGWTDTGETGGDDTFDAGDFYTKEESDTLYSAMAGEVERIGKGANLEVLEFDTDAATTRAKVLAASRKKGYSITYHDGARWVREQYTGEDTGNEAWVKDANWNTEVPDGELLERVLEAERKAQEAVDKVDGAMAVIDYKHKDLTEEQYEALETKDGRTIYMITEEG